MAINPETAFPGKITASSAEYPFGKARNITIPGDGTGTPWDQLILNDIFGLQQALLSSAAIVPTGAPDEVGASQYLGALLKVFVSAVDNIAGMKALSKSSFTPSSNQQIAVAGYTTVNDGGGGAFDVDLASTAPTNIYDTFAFDEGGDGRFFRIKRGIPSILQAGAQQGAVAINPAVDAIAASIIKGKIDLTAGGFSFDPGLVVGASITLIGRGFSDVAGGGATILTKLSGGNGILLSGDTSGIEDFEINGNSQSGDGFVITGSRVRTIKILTHTNGQDGWRIGITDDGAGTINANLFYMEQIVSLSNTRHGGFIHHTNTTTSGTFPQGVPNINDGVLMKHDARLNGGDGLRIGNAIDNTFYSHGAQNNTGRGFVLEADARGHSFYNPYNEVNSSGTDTVQFELKAGAKNNYVDRERFGTVTKLFINVEKEKNRVVQQIGDSAWRFNDVVSVTNTVDTDDVKYIGEKSGVSGAVLFELIGRTEDTSGGGLTVAIKRNGDTLKDIFTFNDTGQLVPAETSTASTQDKNRSLIQHRSYTVATVPTASLNQGVWILVTDEVGGAVMAFSDGGNWRRCTDRAVVA